MERVQLTEQLASDAAAAESKLNRTEEKLVGVLVAGEQLTAAAEAIAKKAAENLAVERAAAAADMVGRCRLKMVGTSVGNELFQGLKLQYKKCF
jgi:hypothetical protein